jgi:cysteine desulfurase
MARLYVSAADHPCVLGGGRFAPDQIEVVGVDRQGVVDLEALRAALARHERSEGLPLVAIHAANNETGVVQPFAEVAAAVREAGGVLVLDAVQAAGRIPLDITKACGDYLILSSHKIGGPKGVGAIVAAADLMMPKPLITGGGQEKGHRAGTENLAAIVGFGAAAREARAGLQRMEEVRTLRDQIEAFLAESDPGIEIFGHGAERLPNTTFFSIPGLKAETAQIAFDLAGVALSAGSACSSGKVGASHVLKAMGRGDQAGALRLSIGLSTTREEIALFKTALAGILARRAGRAA